MFEISALKTMRRNNSAVSECGSRLEDLDARLHGRKLKRTISVEVQHEWMPVSAPTTRNVTTLRNPQMGKKLASNKSCNDDSQ